MRDLCLIRANLRLDLYQPRFNRRRHVISVPPIYEVLLETIGKEAWKDAEKECMLDRGDCYPPARLVQEYVAPEVLCTLPGSFELRGVQIDPFMVSYPAYESDHVDRIGQALKLAGGVARLAHVYECMKYVRGPMFMESLETHWRKHF